MARWTTRWRSTRWARWLGWTALGTVGLGLWGMTLFWWDAQFRVPGPEALFWVYFVGVSALAFAIGVRFAEWSWVSGVVVANVLWLVILVWGTTVTGTPQSGSGQAALGFVFWFILQLPVMVVAAVAGVWWGKRRNGSSSGSRATGPAGTHTT